MTYAAVTHLSQTSSGAVQEWTVTVSRIGDQYVVVVPPQELPADVAKALKEWLA